MSFVVPTFNITVNYWRFPNAPPAAHSGQFMGNLAFGRRIHANTGAGAETFMFLLLPARTDIRSPLLSPFVGDLVEAPAGTLRLYQVVNVDDAGRGFANEHRVAALVQIASLGYWPSPMP